MNKPVVRLQDSYLNQVRRDSAAVVVKLATVSVAGPGQSVKKKNRGFNPAMASLEDKRGNAEESEIQVEEGESEA